MNKNNFNSDPWDDEDTSGEKVNLMKHRNHLIDFFGGYEQEDEDWWMKNKDLN